MPSPRDFQHWLALRSDSTAHDAGSGLTVRVPDSSVAAQLVSAEQTLRDVSHALAHDLRTSMRHVVSYAQMLTDPAHAHQTEQVMRLSHKVLEASRRLQQLMDSVSALARLQPRDLRHETVNTEDLLRTLIRELDQSSEGSRVACVLAPGLPLVRADAILLRRVWRELMENAWRHARHHAQPRIDIGHAAVPGGHAFLVHDNGPGFEPSAAPKLFGMFQGARGAPVHGPGVGLAMVRRIIECHGGRVWASSVPGEGASFGFSLPTELA